MSSSYNTRRRSFRLASGGDDFDYFGRNMRPDFSAPSNAARARPYRSGTAPAGGDGDTWRHRRNDHLHQPMSMEDRSYEGYSSGERIMTVAFLALSSVKRCLFWDTNSGTIVWELCRRNVAKLPQFCLIITPNVRQYSLTNDG